jgi:hypothetical protein
MTRKVGKALSLWIIFALISSGSVAQTLTPLTHQVPRTDGVSGNQPLGQLNQADTLQLPFFDDFAQREGQPDPRRWRPGGGVRTSYRYAADPVTIRAATFDGLTAEGLPYGTITSIGPVDTLTSRPIRLSALRPVDSLYLSFYWQAGGLGDAPNFSTAGNYFLRLEFLRNTGEWVTVWQQNGLGRTTPFAPVMLPLLDPAFFHRGFSFRFISSGSRGGARDIWLVDYVQLDRNRRFNQLTTPDVAIRYPVSPLLRRYTAMPVHQFFVNPAAELSESVHTFISNRNTGPAAISWRGVLRNLTTGQPADTFLRGNAVIPPLDAQYRIQGAVGADRIVFSRQPLRLRHTLFLTTKEADARFRFNDTVSRVTELGNYFAYDDGTAETGFSFNATGTTHVAYRYDLNQPDQVAGFQIYFTRTNNPGTLLNFRIWRDQNGRPVEPSVYVQDFRLPDAAGLDSFIEVALTEPVPVAGVFYAGWSQPAGTSFVNVGFDLNESAPERLFGWTSTTGWTPLQLERGAVLFRPVMSGVITSVRRPNAGPRLQVHPNPTSGRVMVEGDYEEVCVFTVSGQQLLCASSPGKSMGSLELRSLPPGLYLLHFRTRQGMQVRKVVLQR